jgi:FkbM family methyltransferase
MKLSAYNYFFDDLNHDMYFRQNPSSDLPVINQIFNQKVYALDGWKHKELLEKYYNNQYQTSKPLIVDAGANIGASSVYFSTSWKRSFVISIEPEKYNYSLLKLNTVGQSILPLEGAIGSEIGTMYLNDPGYGDVGFRVAESGDYEVTVYSMDQIIDLGKKHGAAPFICKIDIEGGELELFSKNTEWINMFALIIIELHDWMLPMQGSSKTFIEAISKLDFELLHKGENIFFFNKKLLS